MQENGREVHQESYPRHDLIAKHIKANDYVLILYFFPTGITDDGTSNIAIT